MSERPIIWTITDEDAKTAEQAKHAENMAAIKDAWLREADLLGTAYGALLTKLPPDLAGAIVIEYAKHSLFSVACGCGSADCDDDSDWTDEEGD